MIRFLSLKHIIVLSCSIVTWAAASDRVLGLDDLDNKRPHEMLCSITMEVMTDPVVAADGHSYERTAIETWFSKSGGKKSPKTGLRLANQNIIPNRALKTMIEEWTSRLGAPDPFDRLLLKWHQRFIEPQVTASTERHDAQIAELAERHDAQIATLITRLDSFVNAQNVASSSATSAEVHVSKRRKSEQSIVRPQVAVEEQQLEQIERVERPLVNPIPAIARGHEEVYRRFINGRLVYKGPAGERSFLISDIVNPNTLEGEFNLSGLTYTSGSSTYNIDQELRIKLGYRKSVENESKTTVWLVPQFVVGGVGSSFSSVSWTSEVGIFWTYGLYDVDSFDYFTNKHFDEISTKNLYDLWFESVWPMGVRAGPRTRGMGGDGAGRPTARATHTFPIFLIKF